MRQSKRRAMTLIELMVVVAVVGLLLSLLTVAGTSAIYNARVRNTQQVMANVEFALDVFRTEDPLRLTYNRPQVATFGPLPPYQLRHYDEGPQSVAYSIEPEPEGWQIGGGGNRLSDRLFKQDLGDQQFAKRYWVRFGSTHGAKQANEKDGHDDNRALMTYLTLFTPHALNLPDWALKPLNPDPAQRDYVNPAGTNIDPGKPDNDWIEILGVHDAWGVPLDYMHYVRIEWTVGRSIEDDGAFKPGYFVTDRRAALRSRGLEREEYDAWLEDADPDSRFVQPGRWIWSSSLPRPWFPKDRIDSEGDLTSTGRLPVPSAGRPAGWLRAVAHEANGPGEASNPDYAYLPSGDPQR